MLRTSDSRQLKVVKISEVEKKQQEFQDTAMDHTDALYRTALRMTKNTKDAEDLVQETLLKAYRFFDRFEKGTNIKAWLFKIMMNIFINDYRQKSKKPTSMSYEDVDDNYLFHQLKFQKADGRDPEELLFSRIFDDDVKRAIEELPDDFRIVVVLAFLEEFSYQEIAEIANLQLGTVKSRLHRGRKLLQKSLWEYAQRNGFLKTKNK
jgi:RNA polymerase sigma-70 factor (ECF subfamily)